MRQYNFSVMQPSYDPEKGRCWQVFHRQSGERTLAPSTTAVTDWLVDRVKEPCDEQLGGHQERVMGSDRERGWSTGRAWFLERPQASSQEAV